MKRIVCFLLAMIAVFAMTISASAVDYGCNFSTVSKAVYLENLDTGAVVYEKSADEKMYPASTTKIMTYVVVADNVADFDGTMVTINQSVIDGLDPESTVMGLSDHIGEQYSIRELLYGMMLPSGNDAALVLADYVGSGIAGFVEKMNAKAAELGCTNTHFANPHGLFDSQHYSTARDMATIAKYAATTQSFMDICNTESYTPTRFTQPITNWAFSNIAYQTVYSASEVVKTIDVNFGKSDDKLSLVPSGELTALLPNNYDQSKIKVDLECPDNVDAPVSQDQVIGKATVYYDDMTVGTTDIVANKAVERDQMKYIMNQIKVWFQKNLVLVIIIAVVIILLIVLLVAISKAQKRKQRERARQRARRRYRD